MEAWIIGISAVALVVAIWRILVFRRGVSMSPRVVSYREVRRRNLWRTSGIVMVLALGGAAALLTGNTIPGWIFFGVGIGGVALWMRLYVTRAGQCAQCTYATPCPHREVMS